MIANEQAIAELGKALGPRVHVACLFTAVNRYRARGGGAARAKIWGLPEHTLAVFAMQCVLECIGVEEAIERNAAEFEKLGYRDNRSVFRWVETLNDLYARELYRRTERMVEDIEHIPADGNATSGHLRLLTAMQNKLGKALEDMGSLTEIDSKQINAISGFVDALNGAMRACADVPLTEARTAKIARAIKDELGGGKGGSRGEMSPERIAEIIKGVMLGSAKPATQETAA